MKLHKLFLLVGIGIFGNMSYGAAPAPVVGTDVYVIAYDYGPREPNLLLEKTGEDTYRLPFQSFDRNVLSWKGAREQDAIIQANGIIERITNKKIKLPLSKRDTFDHESWSSGRRKIIYVLSFGKRAAIGEPLRSETLSWVPLSFIKLHLDKMSSSVGVALAIFEQELEKLNKIALAEAKFRADIPAAAPAGGGERERQEQEEMDEAIARSLAPRPPAKRVPAKAAPAGELKASRESVERERQEQEDLDAAIAQSLAMEPPVGGMGAAAGPGAQRRVRFAPGS